MQPKFAHKNLMHIRLMLYANVAVVITYVNDSK